MCKKWVGLKHKLSRKNDMAKYHKIIKLQDEEENKGDAAKMILG
jgi:hypothetical protein